MKSLISAAQGPLMSVATGPVEAGAGAVVVAGAVVEELLEPPLNIPVMAWPAT
jgi:hypothetical protein